MRLWSVIALLCAGIGCSEDYDKPPTDPPDQPPTAQINVPFEGEEIANGAFFVARGQAVDKEDTFEDLRVTWFVAGEERCPPSPPDAEGSTRCDVSFSWDKQSISMRVEDSNGNTHEDEINIVLVEATAPSVNITAPTENASFRQTDLITFEAQISDGEDSPEGLAVYWESDQDGMLDLSHTVSSDGTVTGSGYLSASTHVVRLWAEDTSGRRSQDEVIVHVFPEEQAPIATITQPSDGAEIVAGSLVLFQATVGDEREEPNELQIEWSSNVDGILNTDDASSSGTAEFSTAGLSLGEHAISIEATDLDDMNTVHSVIISVVSEESTDTGGE
ncbi:MAG: hypothetical protein CL930_16810 [Deltaproteobacteria bacterium]|nr:hypothetical protein [Deltaproteobacteria bacterium]